MIVSPVVARLTAGFIIALALLSAKSWADAPVTFADETTCKADPISIPADLLPYVAQEVSGRPINLEADQIDVPVADTLMLKGNAFATQGARGIYADEIIFDKSALSLEAKNAVLYTDQGDRITAESLQLEIETRIGSARNVTLQLARREPLVKRNVVDFTAPTFGQAGFSTAIAGAPGSVKGPPVKPTDVIRLSTGEFIKLGQTPAQIESSDDTASAESDPVEVKAKARATADALFLEGHDRERLQNVIYSRCVAGDDSVLIEASELTLDHASGVGTGEHLKVRFYGVPIAYAPRLSFPINDERKSGLLFPTVGFGENWGFNLEVPYYWNIAPQHDATFSGRYMANRGLLGSGQYRFLGETTNGGYSGIVRGEFIPDDSKFGSSRYGWSYEHNQNIYYWDTDLFLNTDIGYVSDTAYLDDLSDNLQVSSASHIPQTVNLSIDPFDIFVEEENLQINADISAYQTLDSSVSSDEEPYTRLPGINLTWSKGYELNLEDTGGYLRDDSTRFSLLSELGSELVNFTHSKKRKTKGLRLDLQPAISLPMERTYGAITPKLTYAYTAYNVHDQPRKKPSDPTRGIYLFEIGSNLFLEREVSWQAQDHTQTLVPSLSYHYVPYEDQDDLPVFDSGSVGFDNIADAFLGDGFWGSDRIQNFQGFTLGLSSETYELETGDQLLRWELAQQIYLADRDVTLGDDEADSSEFSPFLGEVQFHINEHLSTDGFANWNWDERSIGSWRAGARYSPDFRREFGVSYSWEETINNLELDLTWPLTPQWQIGATALLGQSDDDEDGSYTRVSLGYDACCWAIQLALEDRPSEEEDEEGGLQFMATFSLKGLGRISSNQFEDEFSVTAPNFD